MVPATMCRLAMVAALCAVATCFVVLLTASSARADEPVPLGQVAPTEESPPGTPDGDEAAGEWSGADWSGHDPGPDADPTISCETFMNDLLGDLDLPDTLWDDWVEYACAGDWPWDDWSWDTPADTPPPEEQPADPPAADAPSEPATDAPSEPAANAPSEPAANAPSEPAANAPSEPAANAPSEPAADGASSGDAVAADDLTASALLATDPLLAPTMSVSGTTVSWTPTSGVSSYVFARKVPDQATQYSIVNGTSTTPPAVAGTTVRYSVRTNVSGSAWAREISITYSGSTSSPLTAPTMSVSGTMVKWTAIPGVSSYVFVRKLPGQTPLYSIVNATSVTPPTVPGTTVNYGVRTNVSGSAWAREVSITYPSSTSPGPSPTPSPSPTPQPISGTFRMGVVAGSAHQYELRFLKALGARTARLEFGVGSSAANLASDVDAYARAGIRPLLLAGFRGRVPSTTEAQNLASWARAYGPGGTFWQGKSYPANTAVTHIEFGNETSYSYQFSDNSLSTYATRAQTYALRARDAANAIRAANPRVGLLAQGDNAVNGTAWMTNVMRAAPTLDDLIVGWTIHPYGPNWTTRMDSTINSASAAGARALPLWITEWGLSSDNGRCLSDNYGWNKCMTYSGAASTLDSVLAGMRGRYGSRLGAFYLYQAHDQYASGSQSGREAYFGALQSSGFAKGAYTTEVKANLAVN